MKGVQVTTTARLHLGFLDLAGDLGRRFGSIGLAIDAFETRVELCEAASFEVLGEERERGAQIARRVADRVVFMDQGRIVEDSSKAAFFDRPASDRAQLFLSKILQ